MKLRQIIGHILWLGPVIGTLIACLAGLTSDEFNEVMLAVSLGLLAAAYIFLIAYLTDI